MMDKCCLHCDRYMGGEVAGGCFCPDVPGSEQFLGLAKLPTDTCNHFSDSMSRELSDEDIAAYDRQARLIMEEAKLLVKIAMED